MKSSLQDYMARYDALLLRWAGLLGKFDKLEKDYKSLVAKCDDLTRAMKNLEDPPSLREPLRVITGESVEGPV